MTNATAQCENCSKTKRFANATVNEMHHKTYLCDGCGVRLVMIKKTEYTLTAIPVLNWTGPTVVLGSVDETLAYSN